MLEISNVSKPSEDDEEMKVLSFQLTLFVG